VSTELALSSAPSPSTALSLPLQLNAFYYWVENCMFRLDDLPDFGHDYSSYVLIHLIPAQPGSSLRLAFSALSHAVFGRARKETRAIEDAGKVHAQSMMSTQKDITELSVENTDQLLIAIMLMGSYEVRLKPKER
jgi:hypothetical protein